MKNHLRSILAGVGLGLVVLGTCAASLLTTQQAETEGTTAAVPMEPGNGISDSFARVDHTHTLNSSGCPLPGVWVWFGSDWQCVSPTEASLPACASGEYIVKRGTGWYCEGALPRPWLCAEGKYLRVADGGWVCQEGYRSIGAQTPLDIVGTNPTTSATPIVKLNECPNGFRWAHRDDGWWCEPSLNQLTALGGGVIVGTPVADGGNELDYATATVGLRMCPADQVLVATPPDAGGPNAYSYTCQNVVNELNLTAPLQNTNHTTQNQGRLTVELAPCQEGWTLVSGALGWECQPNALLQFQSTNPGEFVFRYDSDEFHSQALTYLATHTQLDGCGEGQILAKRPVDSNADAGNVWACAAQPTTYNSIYSPILLSADLNRATGQETISAAMRSCGEGEHLSTTMVNDAGVWHCVKDYTEPTCGPGEIYLARDAGVATCVRAPNPEDPPYSVFNTRFTWLSGPTVNTNLFNLWDVSIKEEVAVKFRHYLSSGTWYVEIFWAPGTAPTSWTSVGSEALSSSVVTTIPLCPKNANLCSITYVVSAHLFTPDKDGATYTIFAQPTWNTYARLLPICDTPGQYMVWSTQQQRLICQPGVPEAALANSSGATAVLAWDQNMEDWTLARAAPIVDGCSTGQVMSWNGTTWACSGSIGYADEAGTTEMFLNPPGLCGAGQCAAGVDQWGNADNCFTPAPVGAQYWTGAADSTLTAEKSLAGFTGLVLNTAGTPSGYAGANACASGFVDAISASGATTCATVNLSTDTAATALPATKGGTGKTTTSYGGVLYGDTGNVFNWAVAGNQAQGLFGSSSGGGLPSFQDSFLRSYRNTTWTNSTTSDTAIFTFTIAGSGYHHVECTIPVLCTSTACPQISFGGGTYDSTGYFTVRSHRTAATPNWDHVALDTLSTACTTGCYTSFTNWHVEGSFFEAAADTVYLYGRSSTSGQSVSVYAGATCKWN